MTNGANHTVELIGVEKRFGDFVAVHKTDLAIEEGSFLTLLGPSGCGKTTTLRMIAGLAGITEGEIRIKGNRVNDLPIHKRNLGIVFQNYALFPHKTVYDNVAFGLKHRQVAAEEIRQRVGAALDLVQLPQIGDRMPNQLSGGQQQRIALDANLREDMRVELKRIQHSLGITTVFVTHDQSEALALSDRVVVMNRGRIEQVATPEEVYNRPASEFVASFLGNSNILTATVLEVAPGKAKIEVAGLGVLMAAVESADRRQLRGGAQVKISIRAEKLALDPVGAQLNSSEDLATTGLRGRVTAVDYQGQVARYFLQVGDHKLQAINPIDEHPVPEGEEVAIRVRTRDCIVLPA